MSRAVLSLLLLLVVALASATATGLGFCTPSPYRSEHVHGHRATGARSMTAKKGKGQGVPIQYRGQMYKQQKMKEMMAATSTDDGFPVFNLFVRSTKGAGLWFPFSALKGDGKAKTLVNAYMGPFLRDMYKGQLDKGIANSIFQSKAKLLDTAVQMFPQFKDSKNFLQFGYKISYDGLEEKLGPQKVTIVNEEMTKGWMDNVKDMFKF